MPADDLYWNPMDLDAEESSASSYPTTKQYIDPWDLENYAYIRQHLDSVDSEPRSSLGESQDVYYVPANKSPTLERYQQTSPNHRQMEKLYDTRYEIDDDYYSHNQQHLNTNHRYEHFLSSEHGTANYAAIDELMIRNEAAPKKRRQSDCIYGHNSRKPITYQPEYAEQYNFIENPYEYEYQEDLMPEYYETPKIQQHYDINKPPRNRSQSFSIGDYEYKQIQRRPAPTPTYNRVDDIYGQTSPIYDDIRTPKHKPKHFKLSNYGHLQIDYSCSWNNLNKYIYN